MFCVLAGGFSFIPAMGHGIFEGKVSFTFKIVLKSSAPWDLNNFAVSFKEKKIFLIFIFLKIYLFGCAGS